MIGQVFFQGLSVICDAHSITHIPTYSLVGTETRTKILLRVVASPLIRKQGAGWSDNY